MKNTIRRYLGYYFFSNLVFQKSIFMIFLGTQRGVSVAELSILEVALLLGEFFIEIPAGFFGDKFGRKFCVCIGLLALAISSIGYLIFSSFPVFVGLFILEGAGMAFISGADESLLYDNLKSRNQEKEFLPTLSKAMSLSYVSLSIAAVIGGVLQKYSWNLVYGLTSVMIVVAMIFILGIQEETTEENGEEK
ncbi:MAG: MFS transporter, partial [Psychroflexus sp.]|nr:MFS transporter [Psychroflexus sp.]